MKNVAFCIELFRSVQKETFFLSVPLAPAWHLGQVRFDIPPNTRLSSTSKVQKNSWNKNLSDQGPWDT